MLPLPCMSLPVTLKSSVSIRWLKLQAYVLFNSCVNTSWCIRAIFAKTLELERFQTAKVTFKVIAIWCHSIDKGKEYHAPWGVLVRPRSWSSRTHRSTWLFCRSTSSTSRWFYDSTRLGWFPIDLVDLWPCWSQLSARACLLHGNWRKKIWVQAPDAFPVPSGRPTYWPSFPFLLPLLNIFIVSSRDHKMRSMRSVPKLLWPLVEL